MICLVSKPCKALTLLWNFFSHNLNQNHTTESSYKTNNYEELVLKLQTETCRSQLKQYGLKNLPNSYSRLFFQTKTSRGMVCRVQIVFLKAIFKSIFTEQTFRCISETKQKMYLFSCFYGLQIWCYFENQNCFNFAKIH